jgi:hypothetical protein
VKIVNRWGDQEVGEKNYGNDETSMVQNLVQSEASNVRNLVKGKLMWAGRKNVNGTHDLDEFARPRDCLMMI